MRTIVVLALDLLLPHGGQHRARQNAWRGLVEDHGRVVARREAERILSSQRAA
jgi:hypothetical protein